MMSVFLSQRGRKKFFAASLCLCAAFAALFFIAPQLAPAATGKTSVKAKLAAKDKQVKELKKKLNETRKLERDVLGDLDKYDRTLDEANRRLDATMLDLQRARAQEERLRDQLDDAQEDYDEYRKSVGDRITSFYISGRGGYVEALLASRSFADFIGRVHYMRTIMENDRVMVMNMRRVRDSFKDYHSKLEEVGERQEKLATQIRIRQESIEQERKIRKDTLDKIMNQKNVYIESLERMEQESLEISRMIRSRKGTFQPGPFTGRMSYPARGGLISTFGWRIHPRYGVRKFHAGIDISCPTGTPVIAAESGVVILAGWKRGYGQTVIIQHGGNVSTLYGHGSRVLVGLGETVRRGDIIMNAGATGNATGPHLHFEVRVNGDTVDPVPYF